MKAPATRKVGVPIFLWEFVSFAYGPASIRDSRKDRNGFRFSSGMDPDVLVWQSSTVFPCKVAVACGKPAYKRVLD